MPAKPDKIWNFYASYLFCKQQINVNKSCLSLGQRPPFTVGGKDHCMAGLEFNKTWFDQKNKLCCFLYAVKQLNPNLWNWRPAVQWYFPPMMNVLWLRPLVLVATAHSTVSQQVPFKYFIYNFLVTFGQSRCCVIFFVTSLPQVNCSNGESVKVLI